MPEPRPGEKQRELMSSVREDVREIRGGDRTGLWLWGVTVVSDQAKQSV